MCEEVAAADLQHDHTLIAEEGGMEQGGAVMPVLSCHAGRRLCLTQCLVSPGPAQQLMLARLPVIIDP